MINSFTAPFALPIGWGMSTEKYELKNDQGLTFILNLITAKKNVVSVFKADKNLHASTFELMIADYKQITNGLKLKKKFKLKFSENEKTIYVIEGKDGTQFCQCFIENDGGVFSFITFLNKPGKDYKEYCVLNPVITELAALLKVNP